MAKEQGMLEASWTRGIEGPIVPGLVRAQVLGVLDEDRLELRIGRGLGLVQEAVNTVPAYHPEIGDDVVVAGGDGEWFIVGVLGAARLRSALSVLGTERLHAKNLDLCIDGTLRVRAATIELQASDETHLCAGRLLFDAQRVDSKAEEVVTQAGRVEVHATRLVEQVGDAYHHARGLVERQAGRMRTLVGGALQVFARRTTLSSEQDTTIDGERVLLG